MTSSNLRHWALIVACALGTTHAAAQTAAKPRAADQTSAKSAAEAPKTVAQMSAPKGMIAPKGSTSVHAAGSVIVLADGIVANATLASFQPPAAGFVYER